MKQEENKRYCSIIEDLLPLYVEGLVSEETKKEIETHLKDCNKCLEILKEQQGNNFLDLDERTQKELENETREKEIKCIKNIKLKIFFKIIISIIVTVIGVLVLINLWNTYRFTQDEDGKWILYNYNTGNIKQGMDYTHILVEYTSYKVVLDGTLLSQTKETLESRGKVTEYVLYTFNKKDICVNGRRIISGYDEDEIQDVYEWYANTWKLQNPNVKIENGKLYMNENVCVGKTKEKIIKGYKDYNAKFTEF